MTVTLIVIAVVLPFAQLKFGKEIISPPFITVTRPMAANSFVWMLACELQMICFSLAAYRASVSRLKIFFWLWLWYCVYDLIMFFWCYNEVNYYYVPYLILLLITIKLFKR